MGSEYSSSDSEEYVTMNAVSGMDQCAQKRSKIIETQFATYLFEALIERNRANTSDVQIRNLICSPLGIQSALTIYMSGARGNTLKEIMNVLHPNIPKENITPDDARRMHSVFMNVCKAYNTEHSDTEQPVVHIANKLWIANTFEIQDFHHKELGYDTVSNFDGIDAENSAKRINEWIAMCTDNMIKTIVDVEKMAEPNLSMLVTSAIYFSGNFRKSFEQKDSLKKQPFFTDNSRKKLMNRVSVMYSKKKRFIARNVNGIWDIVKLQYADSTLSLFLIINNHGNGGEAALSITDLIDLKLVEIECEIVVPKFQIEGEIVLDSVLKEMGIIDSFDEDNADFTAITGITSHGSKALFLSAVIHKAVLILDDDGTKSDTPNVVGRTVKVLSASLPVMCSIRFHHPFHFHIIDEEGEIVLLSGRFPGM